MHPGKIRQIVIEEVEKMINCGDIKKGYLEFSCNECGESKKVGFKCRSRFCTSCGKGYVDQRAENMTSKLINVKHRHMVFTIAEELRGYFLRNRDLLELLPRCAAKVLKAVFKKRNKKEEFVPGIVTVIHTFGRDLKWNPHVHVLVSEGGSGNTIAWKVMSYIHYASLRKSWQKLLLDALGKEIKRREFKNLRNKLYREYKDGFYEYGKGEVWEDIQEDRQ